MNEQPWTALLDELLESARPEQKAAVTAPEALVVVGAGAGTGKTKTLAWRFLWALLAFPQARVENILTLTFTEKAAREMRERIAGMLETARESAQKRKLGDIAARLEDAQNRLDEAYISTIHAFAYRVIRESGLALPLDPGVDLVSPPQEEAFWEGFSAALDSLDPAEASRNLAGAWKERALQLAASPELAEAVNTWNPEAMAAFAREAAALHGSRGLDPEDLWAWDPAKDEAIRSSLLAERSLAWGDLLADFRAEVFPGLGPLDREKTQLGKRLNSFRERWREGPPDGEPPGRLAAFLADLDETLKGASGKLKDTLAALIGEPPASLREALKKELPLARSLVEGLSAEENAARRTLARVAAVAWVRWRETRNTSGTLTFDDLIRYASEALSANPAYGNRFAHLLVDEYQDTDPLQDDLVSALWNREENRLFLVGDLKQSIYRFRHAEPSLFAGRIREAKGNPWGRYVLLDKSYRMNGDLVEFVNGCFGGLWSEGLGKGLGVAYEPLAGPVDAPWWEERNALSCPPVTLLLETHREDPVSEEKEKKAAVRNRLAARLAATLASMRGKDAWDKNERAMRPLGWKDMAVLVPGRLHYASLQDAFEAAGIPAVFQKSQGYFSRGEVFDIVSLLRALADPFDDLAVAGWLASPFPGLCKEEALRLAGAPGREIPPLLERLRDEFPEIAGRFDGLRAKALLAGPASALDGMMSSPAALRTAPPSDRPRMAANLARAAALAREFAAARGGSLVACSAFLGSSLRRALPAEEPDFMAEDEDVVRVMTIHGSKGLEFPVVAVMGLDDEGRTEGKAGPLIASVSLGAVSTSLPGDSETPLGAVLWHRVLEKGALEEESGRLFYVAATRAQDALVLCGVCPVDGQTGEAAPKEATWLSMLGRSHERLVSGALARAASEGADFPKTGGEGAREIENPAGKALRLPEDVPTLASVSATGYALYAHCPRAWRLQARQGLELARERPGTGEPGGPDLGSLAHAVLAEWDFTAASLDRLLPVTLQGPTDPALLRLPPELRPPLKRDRDRLGLREVLGAFLEKPAAARVKDALDRKILRREWPFRVPLDGGPHLAGVIDALWEEDGVVRIRDYKLAAPGGMPDLGTRQMAFYGLAAGRLFPGRRVDLSLVFLRTGEEVAVGADLVPPDTVEREVREMARTGATGPFPPRLEACGYCPWAAFCESIR